MYTANAYTAEQEINFLMDLNRRDPVTALKIAKLNLSGQRRWDAGVDVYRVERYCADLIAGRN